MVDMDDTQPAVQDASERHDMDAPTGTAQPQDTAPRRRRAASRPAGPPRHVLDESAPGLHADDGPPPEGESVEGESVEVDLAQDAHVEAEEAVGGAQAQPFEGESEGAPAEPESSPTVGGVPQGEAQEPAEPAVEHGGPEHGGPEHGGPESAAPEQSSSEGPGPEEAPVEAAEPGAPGSEQPETGQLVAEQAPVEEPRARRPRRATRGVTTVAFSSVPDAHPVEAPRVPVEIPAIAVFQPPDESRAVRRRRDRVERG
ncbi:MAG: hypothetical protein WCF04_11705, partial [Candidatus Nanopelagicales bacterium]